MAHRKRKYRLLWWSLLTVVLFSGYLVKSFPGIYNPRLTSANFYLNADEIFRHYFYKFGLSTIAKEQVLTELRMLVNALALERAQGKSLSSTLIIMDGIVRKKMASPSIIAELNHFDDYLHPYAAREIAKQTALARHAPVLDIDSREFQQVPFAAYIRSQSDLVEKYHLPYRIPASASQVMDIQGNRFLKVDPSPNSETNSSSVRKKSMLAQLKRFRWENADILLGHAWGTGNEFSIQGYWNHIGIYDRDRDRIIDAWPNTEKAPGGVMFTDKTSWAAHFDEIAVLRLGDIPLKTRKAVVRRAASKLGEPYRLSTYKLNPNGGWYCSKLIYYAYLQEGIDLDPNGGVAVMPDDIAISRGLKSLVYLSAR